MSDDTKLKRYSPHLKWGEAEMDEDEYGEWVRYTDALELATRAVVNCLLEIEAQALTEAEAALDASLEAAKVVRGEVERFKADFSRGEPSPLA